MQKEQEDVMGEAKIKAEAKAEEFAKNPNDFVNVNDCFLVIRKDCAVLNNCQNLQEVFIADGYARETMQNRRDFFRMDQHRKKKGGIIVPGRGR